MCFVASLVSLSAPLSCSGNSGAEQNTDAGPDVRNCSCTVNGTTFACGATSCIGGTKYSCEFSMVGKGEACGNVPCPLATNGPSPDVCDGDTQYCIQQASMSLAPDGGVVTKGLASACAPRPAGCASCDCIGDVQAAWMAVEKNSPLSCANAQVECATDNAVVTQTCWH
jgi:hypothetical protein